MGKSRVGPIAGIVLFLFGTGLLIWGSIPPARQTHYFSLPAQPMTIGLPAEDQDEITLETGLIGVNLVVPSRARVGQVQVLSAHITLQDPDDLRTAGIEEENQANVLSNRTDIFSSYNLVAEGRVDAMLQGLLPSGSIRQPIHYRDPIEFRWTLEPLHPGNFDGKFWIYLNLVNKDAGTDERVALLAYPFAIKCQSFLGLKTDYVLGMGAFFVFLSLLLNIEIIEKFVIKPRK